MSGPPAVVFGALGEDEIGALLGGQDVLVEVDLVDLGPDLHGERATFLIREGGIAVKIGGRVLEGRVSELEEALGVPFAQILELGIHIDGEIEVIGDEDLVRAFARGLQDVEPLDDDDVRAHSDDDIARLCAFGSIRLRIRFHNPDLLAPVEVGNGIRFSSVNCDADKTANRCE